MAADPARVALAHQVLAHLGVSLADLHATQDCSMAGPSAVVMPTIAQYRAVFNRAVADGLTTMTGQPHPLAPLPHTSGDPLNGFWSPGVHGGDCHPHE
jgi:hypothetical protein